jgi:hypothetical protein
MKVNADIGREMYESAMKRLEDSVLQVSLEKESDDMDDTRTREKATLPDLVLLSTPEKCDVTADSLGHAGPPTVLLEEEWNRERWAVNAKPVAHWIVLTWKEPVLVVRATLNWHLETVTRDNYELQIKLPQSHKWETVVKSPNPSIIKCFGDRHVEHEIDVPCSTWTTSLRLCIGAVNNGETSMWQIKVFGYESTGNVP